MIPGIHIGVSNDDYHGGPGISKSGLDAVAKSPAHYFAEYLDPNRPPRPEPSAALIGGTLAHCATLEPAEFPKRYLAMPTDAPRKPTDVQRNAAKPSEATLEAIAWWDSFNASAAGREVITVEQMNKAFAQAASLIKLPDIAEALSEGVAEASVYWNDPRTGVLCKIRPDWIYDCHEAGVILVDVKTTANASEAEFARSVAKWKYHKQAAFYSDGFQIATGRPVLGFVFACVESDYPYLPAAFMLDEQAIEQGRREYRRDLDTYATCLESGNWPGYPQGVRPLSLPRWAIDSDL